MSLLSERLLFPSATALIFAMGTALLPAQSVENEKLTEYRKTFESELEKRLEPLKNDAVRRLEILEKQRAVGEDYEGAMRARDRRIGITGGGPSPLAAVEKEEEGVITLKMTSARTAGNTVMLDRRRNAIVGFKKKGHSASWDVMNVKPGWYKVLATYGCAESFEERVLRKNDDDPSQVTRRAGGTFRFYEDTSLITQGSEPIVKTVVPTGGWDRLVTRNIGKLKITGTRTTLTLEVMQAEDQGIMFLRGIRLVPTVAPGEESVALASGADAPAKLQSLREQYEKKIAAVTRGTVDTYVSNLKQIEEKFIADENLDGALAARKERERMETRMKELEERE